MLKSFCIGLTGGIASGKSTAIAHFKTLGAHTLSADDFAHRLLETDEILLKKIAHTFGPSILKEEKHIKRSIIRHHCVEHPEFRQWLESQIHTKVIRQIQQQIEPTKTTYYVIEMPLILEIKNTLKFDRICLVDATPSQQKQRLKQRNTWTQAHIEAFIALQATRTERLSSADDIINNTDTIKHLHAQVEQLHQQYRHDLGQKTP